MQYKHGFYLHPLYFIWNAIKRRCYSEKCKAYKNYGARGIKLCEEWTDFMPFYEWCIKNGWKRGLTIDREDNDGNYSPTNCRFVGRNIQAKNRRSTIILTYNGESMCLMDWSRKTGISHDVLSYRYHRGYCVEDIFKIK